MMEVEQGGSAKTQTTSDLVSPLAGRKVPPGSLINVSRLLTDYFTLTPEPQVPAQRVIFGTSGHRGSAHDRSFNEWHVLAITQAICDDRQQRKIDGPLFLGIDTHALSESARASVLQVLAANGVLVQLAGEGQYTPTPAISLAIVTHNRGRQSRLADGIVLTPSHNSPRDGGFKYNPPHGGPAGQEVTGRIESVANQYLDRGLVGVRRISVARALTASTTARYDFMSAYVEDLSNVIDLELLRAAQVRMAVDPMGGAGVHYWPAIAERLRLDITVLNPSVDPTFSFMRLDWDGKIRMDPSSAYVMQALVERRAAFDVLFACDTDHDRHGIVCESMGLLSSNQYLPLAIDYLLRTRTQWSPHTAVGKSVVSTALIDAVVKGLGRKLCETPVGFKWFAPGLLDGSLGVCSEESAGLAFARRDGNAWTTDKDGITAALLSAEIIAREGRDLGELYRSLTQRLGSPVSSRVDSPLSGEQKVRLAAMTASTCTMTRLADESILSVIDKAPGNGMPIGGIKVISKSGWFAARPSGTEDLCKIYAESFKDAAHLQRIVEDAQAMVQALVAPAKP